MVINAFGTPMGQVRGLIRHIHKPRIPETNLRQWQNMIREDPDWWPWQTRHGRHRRIFSPLEEISIVSFIRADFIEPGLISNNFDFREIATNVFLQSHTDFDEVPPLFRCSPEFVPSFKARYRLSSRKIHSTHRPAVTNGQRADRLVRIRALLETLPPSGIINCDEISWLLHPKSILTCVELGYQAVQAKISGDEKTALQS
jgi:hypothetical protein